MTTNDTSGPAFPFWADSAGMAPYAGMTLRDYFAAKAMQGLLAADAEFSMNAAQIAKFSYEQSDAMLKAREQ